MLQLSDVMSTSKSNRNRAALEREPGRVGVRELRQNLSVYLERVKAGESLTVTERGSVVALLSPLARELSPVERLIAEGRATPATRPLSEVRPIRRSRSGDRPSEDVIAEMRDERLL